MWPRISIGFLVACGDRQRTISASVLSPGSPSYGMKWMSASGIPAALNWSASSLATRGTSPRWWTLGISIACLNTARVFACHAGGNCVGTVRGSVAATAALDSAATKARPRTGFIEFKLLFAGEVAQHHLPMHDIVVQRLHRQTFVAAMRAIVDRNH